MKRTERAQRPLVDYDRIAPTYDERYRRPESEGSPGVIELLNRLAAELRAQRVLEVGCGTGHWLSNARSLARATASLLPFRTGAFDLLFCVNAIHHFDDARRFVAEAASCLRRGGELVTIGMDPSARRDRWYLYEYFPGTLEADVARYPSSETIARWMREAGFGAIETGVAHRIHGEHVGREVLDEPTLQKNSTSQLVLLTDDAYEAGRRRIDEAIARGEASGSAARFAVDISLVYVLGRGGST